MIRNELDANKGYICYKTKHNYRFVLPLQKRVRDKKIFCRCATCEKESWVEFPVDVYEIILKDYKSGKIHGGGE